jgi:hypothetical protein
MFIPLGRVAVAQTANVQNALTIFDDGLKKQNTSFVGNIILHYIMLYYVILYANIWKIFDCDLFSFLF